MNLGVIDQLMNDRGDKKEMSYSVSSHFYVSIQYTRMSERRTSRLTGEHAQSSTWRVLLGMLEQ